MHTHVQRIVGAVVAALVAASLASCATLFPQAERMPEPDHARIVREDAEELADTASQIDPAELAQRLREDEYYAFLESHGFDIDAYAQAFASTSKAEVKSVEVKGDVASVELEVTYLWLGPDFQSSVSGALEGADYASMTDEDAIALFVGTLNDQLAAEELPVAQSTQTVEYKYADGTWSLVPTEQPADS